MVVSPNSDEIVLSRLSKRRTKGQAMIVSSLSLCNPSALRPLYQMCHITVTNEIRWTSIVDSMKSIKHQRKCLSVSVCGIPL